MGTPSLASRISPRMAGVLVAALWLAFAAKLVPWGVYAIPDSLKPRIAFTQYLAACQVVTIAVGLGLSRALLSEPRETLGFTLPRFRHVTAAALLTPLVYVAASTLALRLALPTLLGEIASRGHGVAREEAGAIGQRLEQAPLLFTLVWGAVLAAVGEELLFRGALWSAIRSLVPTRRALDAPADSLASAFVKPSRVGERLRSATPGFVATIASAGVFGAMHHDMKGSVGIVHVVSTTILGLACGRARDASGGVGAPIVLHTLYNVTVIANARRFFGVSEEPLLSGLPDSLVYIAAAASALFTIGNVLSSLREQRARAAVDTTEITSS